MSTLNKFDALGKEVIENNTEIHTINNPTEQPKKIQGESTKKWVEEAFGKQLDSKENPINNKDQTTKKSTSDKENEVKHTTNKSNPTSSVLSSNDLGTT